MFRIIFNIISIMAILVVISLPFVFGAAVWIGDTYWKIFLTQVGLLVMIKIIVPYLNEYGIRKYGYKGWFDGHG